MLTACMYVKLADIGTNYQYIKTNWNKVFVLVYKK